MVLKISSTQVNSPGHLKYSPVPVLSDCEWLCFLLCSPLKSVDLSVKPSCSEIYWQCLEDGRQIEMIKKKLAKTRFSVSGTGIVKYEEQQKIWPLA